MPGIRPTDSDFAAFHETPRIGASVTHVFAMRLNAAADELARQVPLF